MKKILLSLALVFTTYVNAQIISASPVYRPLSVPSGIPVYCGDADADLFIYNASLEGSYANNVCWLVDTLKSTGIWNKFLFIYPFLGDNNSSCRLNLINPNDADAAFRINFVGGWTYAPTGVKGNGTNAYANTFFNCRSNWTDSLGCMGIFSRTNEATATKTEMGAVNTAYTENASIFIRFGDTFYGLLNTTTIAANIGNTVSNGWYFTNRVAKTGTNSLFIQKNATQTQFTLNASVPPNFPLYIGAINENAVAKNFSTKEFTIAVGGRTLTTTQATTLYNIVTRWNTKTSR